MNRNRKEDTEIRPEFMELRLYNGYAGAETYYYETKGVFLSDQKKAQDALASLSTSISIAKTDGADYADALLRKASILQEIGIKLVQEGDALTKTGKEGGSAKMEDGMVLFNEGENAYKEARGLGNLDAFALDKLGKYLADKDDPQLYDEATALLKKSIETAPFLRSSYGKLWELFEHQGKYADALELFQSYKQNLDKLNGDINGPIFDIKNEIQDYINTAKSKIDVRVH